MSAQQSTRLATSVPSAAAPMPHAHRRRVAVERDELLAAVEHGLDRPAGLAREGGGHGLQAGERLGPERAAHRRRDHADPLRLDAEDAGEVVAQVEGRLGAGVQLEPAVGRPARRAWRAAPSPRAGRRRCGRSPPPSRRPARSRARRRRGRAGSGGRRSCRPAGARRSTRRRRPSRRSPDAAAARPRPPPPAGRTRPAAPRSSTASARAAARAAAGVGAATAATMSPTKRAGSASTCWSLSWQP